MNSLVIGHRQFWIKVFQKKNYFAWIKKKYTWQFLSLIDKHEELVARLKKLSSFGYNRLGVLIGFFVLLFLTSRAFVLTVIRCRGDFKSCLRKLLFNSIQTKAYKSVLKNILFSNLCPACFKWDEQEKRSAYFGLVQWVRCKRTTSEKALHYSTIKTNDQY